jgi:plasmid stabilization system protein ParE
VYAGYRFLVTGNYLSFYHIDGADISIDRILYGRRDYLSVLIEGMFENP